MPIYKSKMNKRRKDSKLEEKVYSRVKSRLSEAGWRGESTRSYGESNLSSIPEFYVDELADELVNSIGRRVLSQINTQPVSPETKRNLQQQLKELLASIKKDVKKSVKSHLERFFQVY